jgi:hypothetical protein
LQIDSTDSITEADSTKIYEIPEQSDIFVLQITTTDANEALSSIAEIFNSLQEEGVYIFDILLKLLNTINGTVSYQSTLSRRLYLNKKPIFPQDRRDDFTMKRNRVLKVMIDQLLDTDDPKIDEFCNSRGLEDIAKSLERDEYYNVENREDLIKDINDFTINNLKP